MKESIRMIKSRDKLGENNRSIRENNNVFDMYKMLDISVKNFTDAKLHTITIGNRRLFCVKMCDVQKRLGVENIYDLLRKEIWGIYETDNITKEKTRKYKNCEKELDNDSNFNFTYARSGIILEIITHCRKTKKAVEFKTKLRFDPINLIMSKGKSMTIIIIIYRRKNNRTVFFFFSQKN